MALLLSIDTALEEASICISEDERVIDIRKNNRQADHAAWIQQAIKNLVHESGGSMGDLSAIAVTSGPGSYTGLRVGMSTAKGICYALKVPLITESTLLLIAQRVKQEMIEKSAYTLPALICPMIDARRMEVFTTLYDFGLREKMTPAAVVLDENSFSEWLSEHVIVFCGNGSKKWQNLCMHVNAVFVDVTPNVADLAAMASKKFNEGSFADLAYTEPAYIKSVYTGNPGRLK
jgi:tRNA threonylcarbamoyladenosine biosynthesis protein TsaB